MYSCHTTCTCMSHYTSYDCPYPFQRPPVEWGDCPPKAATYVFPYVVAWMQESSVIKVYNLVHQRCVQEIPFLVMENLSNSNYFLPSYSASLCLHSIFHILLHSNVLVLPSLCSLLPPFHPQSGRYMGEFAGKLYAALDKSVYLLSAVPLKDQVREANSYYNYNMLHVRPTY